MYFFSFTRFAGFDRVFCCQDAIGNPGDLLETATGDFLLHLGEEISFSELYTQRCPQEEMKVVYPGFFNQHFLSFLHWMVYEWYSTYKNVMKYFVSMEIQDLLLREAKVKGSGKGEQTLIIFPDNWTRYAMLDGKIAEKSLQLYSTDTQNRKDINWWAVKKGQAHTVVATQSEVFQPFKALKKIIFIDSQKWYYHNQQDPRYSLSTVVKKMAELYEAEVEEVKNERRLM